jgi:hypothetical protein
VTARINKPAVSTSLPPTDSRRSDGLHAGGVSLTITVRVYDLYGLPAEDRRSALAVTSEALADAGVAIDWIECVGPGRPDVCHEVLARGEMVLRLNQYPHRAAHILGAAIVQHDGPNVLATVYTPALILRSLRAGVKFSTIVGRVAAHEIGHLLIGTNSHSPIGLMRPGWDVRRSNPTDWRFSGRDAAAIRSRLLTSEVSRAAAVHATN